jgi:hypothetical protein
MSRRTDFHAFVVSRRQAAAGDDAAAERYAELAARAGEETQRAHYQQAAKASRESAQRNRQEISDRLAGRRPTYARRGP